MKLNVNVKNSEVKAELHITRNGYIVTDLWGTGPRVISSPGIRNDILKMKNTGTLINYAYWETLRDSLKVDEVTVNFDPKKIWGKGAVPFDESSNSTEVQVSAAPVENQITETSTCRTIDGAEAVRKWNKFFSEFNFTPQVRFINSIARCGSAKEVSDYIIGYFSLTNNSYANELKEKMKSDEYKLMAEEIYNTTNKVINSRFEVYYGEPGGGKTTYAQKKYPNADLVLCHSNMTPDELFRGFDFTEDGKPTFKPCPVKEAMKNGKPIILDEINLLNEDCRRTLQGICDQKPFVTINDERIEIKPGFKIIGTMNLVVDEQVFGLPAPLVDRAEKIEEFSMTPSRVAALAF